MANRPQFFAFLDRLLTNVDLNYASNNLNFTGKQPLDVIESKIVNTLQLVNGLWATYQDYKTIKTDEQIDTATAQRWSTDKLEYANGQSVTIGVGATPATKAVYYLDSYRVEIDECLLAPNGADPLSRPLVPTPGRVWIYLDVEIISDPGQPFATAVIEDVAAGTPANPGPGQLALVGLDINAIGDITANVYPAVEPEAELRFSTLLRRYLGLTRFEDAATFVKTGFDAIIVDGTVKITGGSVSAVSASNDDATNETAAFTNVSGAGVTCTGSHATKGAFEASNTGAGPSLFATKTVAGSAVKADAVAGGGTAVEALGGAYGVDASSTSGSAVRGTASFGIAVEATSLGSGNAFSGLGGPSPASRAAVLLAGDPAATALLALTDPGATTAAVAVQGTSNGNGVGVRGLGLDGYGVVAQTDTSSPVSSALRVVPQDADPSSPLQGDMYFNDNRGGSGIPRLYATSWLSFHASPKGRVFDFGLTAAGGPLVAPAASGNLSLAQILPEETGDVLVQATGTLVFATDVSECDVVLIDLTSVTVLATQIESAIDRDLAGPSQRSFAISARRTLPDAATRTFATIITATVGTVSYAHVITTTLGVK